MRQLLDVIKLQDFKDFEVVVSDDSPDNDVFELCEGYKETFALSYYKNNPALGTPENWNNAIRKANGTWIKLMHDDDFFASETTLGAFANAIKKNPDADLLYSAFVFDEIASQKRETVRCTVWDRFILGLSPYHMFKRNYFGNPSCVIFKKTVPFLYDKRFKYIVDFAYYIELLIAKVKCVYIPETLIHVGLNEDQVTHYTFKNKSVQVYENHVFLEKIGIGALKNILAFDYYWRIYRNFGVKDVAEINEFYKGSIPEVIRQMINFQSKIPDSLLKGFSSKLFMSACYLKLRITNKF